MLTESECDEASISDDEEEEGEDADGDGGDYDDKKCPY